MEMVVCRQSITSFYFQIVMSLEAGGGNEKARQMKKQNSWGDKLKHCAVQIM